MGHSHYALTNEAMDDFYEELKAVFGNLPCKDVKNEMEDMNAKVGTDNTGRTEVMARHGSINKFWDQECYEEVYSVRVERHHAVTIYTRGEQG